MGMGQEGRGRGCSQSQSLARMSTYCHVAVGGGFVADVTSVNIDVKGDVVPSLTKIARGQTSFLIFFVSYYV